MPALTRAAARTLNNENGQDLSGLNLALRSSVSKRASAVWEYREGSDLYTGCCRANTIAPQVDHVMEIQLVEVALAKACRSGCAAAIHADCEQAAAQLRPNVNSCRNLNVTSKLVNQKKRGPFTAALNRMRDDRLRTVVVADLARRGAARCLVDDGTWANIETSIVSAYDALSAELCGGGVAGASGFGGRLITEASVAELGALLSSFGLE